MVLEKKDTFIENALGIPTRTLQDWKNQEKSNWRYKVYRFLKESITLEKGVSDREIQINQRVGYLKTIFGQNLENYKFDIFDLVFKNKPELTDTKYLIDDIKKFERFKFEFNSSLLDINIQNNELNRILSIMTKSNINDYIQIVFEYKLWKLNQKENES